MTTSIINSLESAECVLMHLIRKACERKILVRPGLDGSRRRAVVTCTATSIDSQHSAGKRVTSPTFSANRLRAARAVKVAVKSRWPKSCRL
jgi:hypothetical protein